MAKLIQMSDVGLIQHQQGIKFTQIKVALPYASTADVERSRARLDRIVEELLDEKYPGYFAYYDEPVGWFAGKSSAVLEVLIWTNDVDVAFEIKMRFV